MLRCSTTLWQLVPAIAFALFVVFFAKAAAAQVTVTITKPTAGASVTGSLDIAGSTASTYQIVKVMASVQTKSAEMTRNGSTFSGTLDLTGVPTGAQKVTVIATDFYGTTGSAEVTFNHVGANTPPTVTDLNTDGDLAWPTVRIAASCTDAEGACVSVEARVGSTVGPVVASGTTGFDTLVDLSAYLGMRVQLFIIGTDTAGANAIVQRMIDVENSKRLELMDVLPSGSWLHDVDATRILYSYDDKLTIRTRGTQNDVVVKSPGHANQPNSAWLTTQGAFWTDGEWNGTSVVAHTAGVWRARGNYACGARYDGGNFEGLYRDLGTGTTTVVFPSTQGRDARCEDIASNGDAIFSKRDLYNRSYYQQVYRYRGGVLTNVAGPLGFPTVRYHGGLTDGINVVFHRVTTSDHITGPSGEKHVLTPTGTTTHGGSYPYPWIPGVDYAADNGYVAFTDVTSQGGALPPPRSVSVRSPAGVVSNVTPFASSVDVAINGRYAIHDDHVMVLANKKRYLARPGVPPEEISSSVGTAYWLAGGWQVVIGRRVFKVVPPDGNGGDGGAGDGGAEAGSGATIDAGLDASASPDGGANAAPDASATPDHEGGNAGGAGAGGGSSGDVPGGGVVEADAEDAADASCALARGGASAFASTMGGALAIMLLVRRRRLRSDAAER